MTQDGDLAARNAFAEWASPQAGAPRDAGALVQDVAVEHEHIGILSTDIVGRRVVWKSIPAAGRARVTVSPIAIESIDAWTADAATLRQRSDHIALCDACGGERKGRCAACTGTGKLVCPACGGQRQQYGRAANGSWRLLNCTTCRGKGEVDCAGCRRGIASCGTCDGEGRVQRWIEVESWRRSTARVHPESLAHRFGWSAELADGEILRDAELVFDAQQPKPLTRADLGNVSLQWLTTLQPALHAGERIARQRLRIARAPTYTVRYRAGGGEDRVVFMGRRLLAPPENAVSAFAQRASTLRSLAGLLASIGAVVAILSFARGAFYASLPTYCSLLGVLGMLVAIHRAVADWTGARRHTRHWLLAAAMGFAVAAGGAFAALPRLAHARALLAAGKLDSAQRELLALGSDAPPGTWADLHLARIRETTDVDGARKLLAKIPRELPQHRAAAPLVYLPLAERAVARSEWSAAAATILEARAAGVDPARLDPLRASMRAAAEDAIANAKRESDAYQRLRIRLTAEAALVAWERASDQWGTPPLIALRAAMARDIATLDKPVRRRR